MRNLPLPFANVQKSTSLPRGWRLWELKRTSLILKGHKDKEERHLIDEKWGNSTPGTAFTGVIKFRLVYELPGVFESVAAGAEGFRLCVAHCPGVGLVAVKTLHTLLHMEVVLTHLCLVGVTFPQTVR